MTNETIQVLIAADHPVVRKGLHALLDEFDDIEIIGDAGDGQEVVALFMTLKLE